MEDEARALLMGLASTPTSDELPDDADPYRSETDDVLDGFIIWARQVTMGI